MLLTYFFNTLSKKKNGVKEVRTGEEGAKCPPLRVFAENLKNGFSPTFNPIRNLTFPVPSLLVPTPDTKGGRPDLLLSQKPLAYELEIL